MSVLIVTRCYVDQGVVMGLRIRSYRKQDEKEWIKCHVLVDLEATAGQLLKEKPKYDGKSVELVATVADRLVGFLDIEMEEPGRQICLNKAEGNGMLWDIGVLKECRGRGIGLKLLREGIRRARKLGLRRLEAWTVEKDAKGFYEKFGFKRFYDYHHVELEKRMKLKAFDRDGMHVISLYAHVMPEADIKEVVRKYEPKQVHACSGFEIHL
jgi:ribosomal protein S18 acetylase RimI-like enzyme